MSDIDFCFLSYLAGPYFAALFPNNTGNLQRTLEVHLRSLNAAQSHASESDTSLWTLVTDERPPTEEEVHAVRAAAQAKRVGPHKPLESDEFTQSSQPGAIVCRRLKVVLTPVPVSSGGTAH
jgi:hypothetical protein